MTMGKLASGLIRDMRNKVKAGAHGGLRLSSEDAIAWEQKLNTALAAIAELEAESEMLANALEARMRWQGGRPRLVLVTDHDGGDAA